MGSSKHWFPYSATKIPYGDVVMPGAFAQTLTEWEASGDPIPVYWSHRMDGPEYNIGHVTKATETDEGLVVTAQLDLDGPTVQVYRLLKARRVKQFSFAYEVIDGAPRHRTTTRRPPRGPAVVLPRC